MTVRYLVVGGSSGRVLAQRQADAIRHALAWLATHPDHETTTATPHQAHSGEGEG
ncbi:hypothetical protein OHU11_28425 [Streptomyces sp. NBC_00257]|uniref:hypothetical protein n=1 Tax=unclassified Streptomyces TaxID=2593676 RepID=UPI0022577F78|nr:MULTISPECIES: hypothetical protein [unclassified Streptomyces]MCX5431580.1 hypothetical protein [Streptomyces sp. NBC_00062]